MRRVYPALLSLLLLLALGACRTTPTPEPTATSAPSPTVGAEEQAEPTATSEPEAAPGEEPLYVALIWHQHQPVYFKDPATGVYQKPWVRVHAAKDYVDMAAILERYPSIKATFNLTPSLLRQLIDLEQGAKDLYEVYTEIPADQLTDEDKAFIQARFFDINPKIIARFPRYQEIANDRDNWQTWDEQTWRDLQVLFNLGWTDPDWLAQEPLASLVEKGRNFTEEEKAIVLAEHRRLIAEVIPLHKRLQDEGRIEVTFTPFFHPILPLLVDTNLARKATPDLPLPPRFAYGVDAIAQVEKGVQFYEETFGRAPTGMWPAEGAVAQEIVGIVAGANVQWMASDEEVLARSLGKTGFNRDAREVVRSPDELYRPYIVSSRNGQVYIIFRDKVLSDKVGFTYSGMSGTAAAQDFVRRLRLIREELQAQGAEGPHLVSVILDGENAWEHYDNDGKEFLNTMYQLLEEAQAEGVLQTVTPSEFIAQYPDQPRIEELWAGSWVSPDYTTWIGEEEENRAWEYLGRVREFVARRLNRLDDETAAAVMDAIYTAEGSDWFWWYGSDQNSGDDASFDAQFRQTLQRVYELMGEPVPTFLKVPIIPEEALPPQAGPSALISPTIDGVGEEGEWEGAGYYIEEGGVQATPNQVVDRLWYGFDANTLYLRLDGRRAWADVADEVRLGFYLRLPSGGAESFFSHVETANGNQQTPLGFGVNALVEVTVQGDTASAALYTPNVRGEYEAVETEAITFGVSGNVLEVALPYDLIGKPDAGATFTMRAIVSEDLQRDIQIVPSGGPLQIVVPDLGLTTPILAITDPEGDDHGPGTYTYPLDPVFTPGAYDITEFAVAEDDNNLIFRITTRGGLNNEWGAPNGMGIHTVDIYIDAKEGGARLLLPGRNAATPENEAWDIAIWAEGWTPGIFVPGAEGPEEFGSADMLNIVSDPTQKRITIRVPKAALAEALGTTPDALTPTEWGYLAVVLSQEGFPSAGVWRVRDVEPTASQWRLGGAPADINHTRIIDVAYPESFTPTQEEALSTYPSIKEGTLDDLTPDDVAQLPMVRITPQ